MNNELIITQSNYETLFAGARDVITHQPYRIGDRVVRCRRCRAIIKTEFVDTRCPMCGASPFISVRFDANVSGTAGKHPPAVSPGRYYHASGRHSRAGVSGREYYFCRSRWTLAILLVLAVVASTFPFRIDGFRKFVSGIMPDMRMSTALVLVVVVSAITAVITACCPALFDCWRFKRSGFLVVLIPVVSPYLAAAVCMLVVFVIGILIKAAGILLNIVAHVLCISLLIGIFA